MLFCFHNPARPKYIRRKSKSSPRLGDACSPLSLRTVLAVFLLTASAFAQPTPADRTQILKLVDANAAQYKQVSKDIWGFAELGYHENKSSALLQDQLKKAGFSLQAGVADEPTAFIASYGSGKP